MLQPRSIQIQTIDDCNRKCIWCPNSVIEKRKGLMPIEVFDKILADLKKYDYQGNLHLYLMAEPLLDQRIKYLIGKARHAFPDNSIFISTNGDLLESEKDVADLFKAGLTWMGVSHYDDSNKFLYDLELTYKIVNTPLNSLRHTFYNRGGNVGGLSPITPQPYCDWVFDKAYVNWRGDVILCCSDYHYETSFGNVMEKNVLEIFNSKAYGLYRQAHSMKIGHRMALCNKCNRIGGCK